MFSFTDILVLSPETFENGTDSELALAFFKKNSFTLPGSISEFILWFSDAYSLCLRKISISTPLGISMSAYPPLSVGLVDEEPLDLSENSKARLFKALRQNFDICGKTQ
ncbi:hypothetical protein [Nostoc sp. TCL240-02]|uniref:hypothetical protein n=1 Tax=Nostoc sp. TCL240-02 TaxID=2572090 RepID=UPI00157F835D|nr:hypothetical protein [Nostoc sp. TCL240-02]QKQ74205.1 hypothetical protein FBB35_13520 [Nostoc sp. TCL240-02]